MWLCYAKCPSPPEVSQVLLLFFSAFFFYPLASVSSVESHFGIATLLLCSLGQRAAHRKMPPARCPQCNSADVVTENNTATCANCGHVLEESAIVSDIG